MNALRSSRPLLLFLQVAACVGAQHSAIPVPILDPAYNIEDLAHLNGLDGTIRQVFRSEAEWKRFWQAQQLPEYAITPTGVDFTRRMILLVGADLSGKILNTRIDHVLIQHDTLIAYVGLSTGKPNCVIFPVQAVLVQRSDLPVRFMDVDQGSGCGEY
jgi:hypothetical protein